jgi:hypothetical protein
MYLTNTIKINKKIVSEDAQLKEKAERASNCAVINGTTKCGHNVDIKSTVKTLHYQLKSH